MLQYLLLLIVLWCAWWYKVTRVPKNFPPGPRFPLPVIGDLHLFGGNIYMGFRKFRKRYGDIYGFSMGPRKVVALSTYELIQEAFSKPVFAGRAPLPVWFQLKDGISLASDIPGKRALTMIRWQ